jgi:hypothetical protein
MAVSMNNICWMVHVTCWQLLLCGGSYLTGNLLMLPTMQLHGDIIPLHSYNQSMEPQGFRGKLEN